MLFVELRFLFFFLLVFAVHWALRGNTSRKWWLLVCNHFFYACFFIGDPGTFWDTLRAGAWEKLPPGWWFPMPSSHHLPIRSSAALYSPDARQRRFRTPPSSHII